MCIRDRVWDRHGQIIEDLCYGNIKVINDCIGRVDVESLSGNVCLLGNRGTANYYHWMNDALPRLAVLEGSGINIDDVDHFIARPLNKPFHLSTLEALRISENQIAYSLHTQAESLFVPIFGSNTLGRQHGKWVPEFLGGLFEKSDSCNRRLYISRGSSGARGVVNEPEVVEFLQSRGFECIELQNHPVSDQADLFSQSEVVVGPHGAGFTNCVFCQPKTKIIEFFGSHVEPCFWITSELMNLDHFVHQCKTVHLEGVENIRQHVTNRLSPIYIDIIELQKVLDLAKVS